MSRSRLTSCLALLALAASTPSLAQGTTAQRAACTPDVFRLCSGEIPNVGRITACLRRERSRLSGGCGEVFDILDRQQSASRSLSTVRVADPARWCEFGANPVPGQDVWIAWCTEPAN